MDVQPFADNLREAYLDAKLEQARKPRPHHTNHPHSAGHPCARYLVLLRVAWGLQNPFSDRIRAALFAEGHHQERALVSDLRDLHGYFVGLQKVPIALPDLEVFGEWDFCVKREDGPYYVADGKAVSPGIFRALHHAKDLLSHRRYFVRQWPVQLLLYLEVVRRDPLRWAHNTDAALLILKDKVTGEIRPIPIPWDQEIMDDVHDRLHEINGIVATIRAAPVLAVAAEKGWESARDQLRILLPAPLADHSVCPGCPYYTFCQPEMLFPPLGAAEVLEDPDLEAALEIVDKNREAHTEFTQAYDDVKGLLDRYPITFSDRDKAYLVVGPFLVTVLRIAPRGRPEYRKYDIWKRPDPPAGG